MYVGLRHHPGGPPRQEAIHHGAEILRRVPDLPEDHRQWVTDLLVRVLDAESRR